VEMAVVLPFFVMILLAIVEFGRAMTVSQLITTAARDGGRVAIMDGTTNTEVIQIVRDSLAPSLSVDPSDINVTISTNPVHSDLSSAQQGDTCTIQVQVPYNSVSFIPGSYLADKSLKSSCVMRHL